MCALAECCLTGRPTIISIEEAVGPRCFSLETYAVHVPGSMDAIYRLRLPWRSFFLEWDVTALPQHPSTRAALPLVASHGDFPFDPACMSCQLYVYGSCKHDCASWAVAVLWQNHVSHVTLFLVIRCRQRPCVTASLELRSTRRSWLNRRRSPGPSLASATVHHPAATRAREHLVC